MTRIFAVLLAGLLLGVVLASGAGSWPVRPGLLGLLAMAAAAGAARHRWLGLDLAAPGSPERALWIALGSGAVIAGHLASALYGIGAGMELHTTKAHALGTDNWTLVLGGVIAWWVARDPQPRQDERDQRIAQTGLRWSHHALVAVLMAGILPLGFGWTSTVRALSHPMIAHLLILALMLCWLVDSAVRLREYAQDAGAFAE